MRVWTLIHQLLTKLLLSEKGRGILCAAEERFLVGVKQVQTRTSFTDGLKLRSPGDIWGCRRPSAGSPCVPPAPGCC